MLAVKRHVFDVRGTLACLGIAEALNNLAFQYRFGNNIRDVRFQYPAIKNAHRLNGQNGRPGAQTLATGIDNFHLIGKGLLCNLRFKGLVHLFSSKRPASRCANQYPNHVGTVFGFE